MHVPMFVLIIIAEILLALVAGCALLWHLNRRKSSLSSRLQARMGELVADLREARGKAEAASANSSGTSYVAKIEQQLALTRAYHRELGDGGEIAMDLDIETPAPRRVAALRYAMLIAERDALGEKTDEAPNWDRLQSRYQQLMEYYAAEQEPSAAEPDQAQVPDELQEELETYKKRVANLEQFKALYFELETRWNASQEEAQTHYDTLSEMGAKLEDDGEFEEALKNYHHSYQGIADLVEQDDTTIIANTASARAAQQATGEIRHLRNVAADQHRIIYDLQQKLAEASSKEEASALNESLQKELEKQVRYAQESETCIQLLEDELASTHREAEQAMNKLKQFALVKAELKDLQTETAEKEKALFALKSENQRLKNKLRALQKAPPQQTVDPKLKKELANLQAKYTELEERYLEVKTRN